MRKLASVQVISELSPIPNADRIELARVLGWHVIVKKGEFNVGDKCVYVEIDSIMPSDVPYFDFLKDKHGNMKPIKTVKMRGQISQGIAFPMSILNNDYKVDSDVTDVLGVTKWEPDPMNVIGKTKQGEKNRRFHGKLWDFVYRLYLPECISKYLYISDKKPFPSFIRKTDETRVQVLQNLLDKYEYTPCVATEKLDGQSVTIFFDKKGNIHVCSRNYELLDKTEPIWQTVIDMEIEGKIKSVYGEKNLNSICLQGEHVGPGIQGNKYNLPERTIYFFDVSLISDHCQYYKRPEGMLAVLRWFGLPSVPVVRQWMALPKDIDKIVEFARGNSELRKDIPREGVVIRPVYTSNDRADLRFSFKAINPDFLLKYKV